jgi:hypothetical protein
MPQLAGEDILASDIKISRTRSKAVSESVTSSTVLQNDDDFVIALEAGKTYEVRLWLHVSGAAATGDIRTAWATTGTITSLGRSVIGPAEATAAVLGGDVRMSGHGLTTAVVCGCDNATSGVVKEELIVTCTAAGNLTLQWAQGTSNATATTCSTASRIIVTELETF